MPSDYFDLSESFSMQAIFYERGHLAISETFLIVTNGAGRGGVTGNSWGNAGKYSTVYRTQRRIF